MSAKVVRQKSKVKKEINGNDDVNDGKSELRKARQRVVIDMKHSKMMLLVSTVDLEAS